MNKILLILIGLTLSLRAFAAEGILGSNLPTATSAAGTDVILIIATPGSTPIMKKMTMQNYLANFSVLTNARVFQPSSAALSNLMAGAAITNVAASGGIGASVSGGVLTLTGSGGGGGGAGATTNANQFGVTADGRITIKSGALVTNVVNKGTFQSDVFNIPNFDERVLVSDAGGNIVESPVMRAELEYLSGVTANVQTNIDGKAHTVWVNAVSNYVTAATNSASVTNWITLRQPASAGLTNLSANPDVATQLLAGANITITSNLGIYTITATSGGAGVNGLANSNLSYVIGTDATNYTLVASNSVRLVAGVASTNQANANSVAASNLSYSIGTDGTNYASGTANNVSNWVNSVSNRLNLFTTALTNQGDANSVAASNLAYAIGTAATNFSYTIGANGTNYADSRAVALSNLSYAIGTASTNRENLFSVAASNLSYVIGTDSTNRENLFSVAASNLSYAIGTASTNYALAATNSPQVTNWITQRQPASQYLSNVVTAANGTGMLTNGGSGTLGWMAIPSGGGGGISTNTAPQPASVYNADVGLRKWYGKMGAASTSVVHVVIIGNSNAEGIGTSDTNKMPYASIMREAMQSRLGNAGYGIVPAYRGVSTSIKPAWNITGSWASSGNSPGYSPFELEKFATGAANIYEMDAFCDSVTLYGVLWSLGTNAGAGSAYVNIDNGTLSNQVNSYVAANRAYQNTNVSAGALGMHNIRLYAPSAGTKNVGFWGMSANIGTKGVQVHNIGRNGTKVADTSNTLSMASFAGISGNGANANQGPALTIIHLTSNDYSTQADTNVFLAGAINMVNAVGTNGSVIFVGDLFRSGGLTIPQSVYHGMLRAAAFTNSTPFVFVDFLEYYAGQEATIGVSDDAVHFNNRGHQHVAQTLLNLTLPLGASPAVSKTSVTNNFVVNQYYTNQESAAFIAGVSSMTNMLASDLSMMGLYLDQDADGTFEKTGIRVRLQGLIALSGSEELSAMIQPYARFIFTNLSNGGTATIEPNSSQWFWMK